MSNNFQSQIHQIDRNVKVININNYKLLLIERWLGMSYNVPIRVICEIYLKEGTIKIRVVAYILAIDYKLAPVYL